MYSPTEITCPEQRGSQEAEMEMASPAIQLPPQPPLVSHCCTGHLPPAFPILLSKLLSQLFATTLGSQWLFSTGTTESVSQAKVAHDKTQLPGQACSVDLHQQNCYVSLPNRRQQFSPSSCKGISFCCKAIHHPER